MSYNPLNPNGQAIMNNSAPVAIAIDQSTLNVSSQATTSGGMTWASGSIKNVKTAVKAAAGQVYGWYFYNPNNVVVYVQVFNKLLASITVGTTPPDYVLPIPPFSGANAFGLGIEHDTGISIAITTGRADNTAPTSFVDYTIFHK